MNRIQSSSARWIVAVLTALAVAVPLLAPDPGSAQAPACPNQDSPPAAIGPQAAAAATLCLLNEVRAGQGLAPLAANARLAQAAQEHAADMVTNHYFAHDSLTGVQFNDRIDATGYLNSVGRWSVGENLAWGTYDLATPAAIVNGWMNSPGHRANILGQFSEIGIAIVAADPQGDSAPGATYVTDFGQVEPVAGSSSGSHKPRRALLKACARAQPTPGRAIATEHPLTLLRTRRGCPTRGVLAFESMRGRG